MNLIIESKVFFINFILKIRVTYLSKIVDKLSIKKINYLNFFYRKIPSLTFFSVTMLLNQIWHFLLAWGFSDTKKRIKG